MVRFYDVVGYAVHVKTAPGVFSDHFVERRLYGEVTRNSRSLEIADKVNEDLTVGVSIRVVADTDAFANWVAIKYVKWLGSLWTVEEITPERPRLVLRLGGLYRGETAATAPAPSGDTGE